MNYFISIFNALIFRGNEQVPCCLFYLQMKTFPWQRVYKIITSIKQNFTEFIRKSSLHFWSVFHCFKFIIMFVWLLALRGPSKNMVIKVFLNRHQTYFISNRILHYQFWTINTPRGVPVGLSNTISAPSQSQQPHKIHCTLFASARRCKQDFQPTRTRRHIPPRVLRSPAFCERDPHRPWVYRANVGQRDRWRWARGVEDAETVAWSHPPHQQGLGCSSIESRRAHEHWLLAAVVEPHPVRFQRQGDAQPDLCSSFLHLKQKKSMFYYC